MQNIQEVICPLCKNKLSFTDNSAACVNGHFYPVLLGNILNLLSTQDRSQDNTKTNNLLSAFDQANYEELNNIAFQNEPLVPEKHLNIYKNYHANTLKRNQRMTMVFRNQAKKFYKFYETKIALELGCGHGGNMVTLSKEYQFVIGIDPELNNLILANKLLMEQGISNFMLICGYGQNISFPDSSFNYVTAINVMEHVFELDKVVSEIHRVLHPEGIFVADSRNRYDLFFPEPHVKLRFVGLLPRSWARKYVHWRTGTEYNHTLLWSYFDLYRVFKKYFDTQFKIIFARVDAYGYPAFIDKVCDVISHIPILNQLLLLIYPSHLIIAHKK